MMNRKRNGLAVLIAAPIVGITIFSGALLANAAQKPTITPEPTATIDKAKAEEIALQKSSGGTVTKCHLDYEDGQQVYEIEIINKDIEYEMNIDVHDGSITDYDTDRIRTAATKSGNTKSDYDDDWDDDWDDRFDYDDDRHDKHDDDHDDWDDGWFDD